MERTDILIIIGKNIRHRRVLAGLTQKALGYHLKLVPQQVQKYESGENSISCDKLVELAVLFHCSVNDLCKDAVDIADAPDHPWNSYRVQTLISHFNRIRSHSLRNKVCGMVRNFADAASGEMPETL